MTQPEVPGFDPEAAKTNPDVAPELDLELAFAGLTHLVRVASSAEHSDRIRLFDTLTALQQRYGEFAVTVDMVSRDPETQQIGRHAGFLGIWVDTEIKQDIDRNTA